MQKPIGGGVGAAGQEGKILRGVGPIGEFPSQKHVERLEKGGSGGRLGVACLPVKQKKIHGFYL